MTGTEPRTRRTYPDLAAYLRESGDTQTHLARHLGISQSLVSRVSRGLAIPRPAQQRRLARYCRIPLDSFTKVFLARHARRVA